MRILIAGGGTGGHLYPGIAVAREFQRVMPECRILFVGTEAGLEMSVLPQEGFDLVTIPTAGWVGRGWKAKWKVLGRMPAALWRCWRILGKFRPDLMVGVGGYASGPAVLIAAVRRVPTVILEQNVFPGMTNTWLSFIVNRVVVSFEESKNFFWKRADVRCLGNPVRPEIYQVRQRRVSGENPALLVFGGSRGARAINRAMVEALSYLGKRPMGMTIIHQTGAEDHPRVRKAYEDAGLSAEVQPYFHRMAELYRRADLVICRAGATTVAELTAASRPAILIPYPHAARGHQVKNAEAVQAAGGAEMILEKDLSGRTLSDRILGLLTHPERLSRMGEACGRLAKPDAAANIVKMCRELMESKP